MNRILRIGARTLWLPAALVALGARDSAGMSAMHEVCVWHRGGDDTERPYLQCFVILARQQDSFEKLKSSSHNDTCTYQGHAILMLPL